MSSERLVAIAATDRCLNCGVQLHGAFCAACGQRSVPADPTVSELAGDAWRELSGYDGRIASTFRNLLRPGRLTVDYLQGRRARYLPPVRLYLIVSVMYFLVAAATPQTSSRTSELNGPGGLSISIGQPGTDVSMLSAEDRAELLKGLERAPWWVRPVLRAFAEDPEGFRVRVLTIMPRVFFGLLPVFAGIVALFYRGHHFPTTLVFAVHVHAFAFLIFTVSDLFKFTGSQVVAATVGVIAALVFARYALAALRTVFGGGWLITAAKGLGIGVAYLFSTVPAFVIIIAWASLT